jgi:hypothetical protein
MDRRHLPRCPAKVRSVGTIASFGGAGRRERYRPRLDITMVAVDLVVVAAERVVVVIIGSI